MGRSCPQACDGDFVAAIVMRRHLAGVGEAGLLLYRERVEFSAQHHRKAGDVQGFDLRQDGVDGHDRSRRLVGIRVEHRRSPRWRFVVWFRARTLVEGRRKI